MWLRFCWYDSVWRGVAFFVVHGPSYGLGVVVSEGHDSGLGSLSDVVCRLTNIETSAVVPT